MGVIAIRDLFPWMNKKESTKKIESVILEAGKSAAYKNYAIQVAISRIANSLSLAEFITYDQGKEIEGSIWWTLNYEPNKNQNKVNFWQDVLYKMVYDSDGALIVQTDEGFLVVADTYDVKEYDYEENYYSNIVLKSGYELKAGRSESEIAHLTLNNNEVKKVIDSVYDDYGKLIGGAIRNYNRGNALKVIVKIGTFFDQFKSRINEETGESEYDTVMDDIFRNRMKGMLSDNDSATPIEEGLSIEEVKTASNTKSGSSTTRDIKDTFEDIINLVADAFHIPRGIMKGDVADAEVMFDNYLNQCIRPIAEQIQAELNRKLYGFENVRDGTKLKVDTDTIVTRDPIKFAKAAEPLLRIGAWSVNKVLRKMGDERIPEAWADEHYVTKNYESMKGGEKTEKDAEEQDQKSTKSDE